MTAIVSFVLAPNSTLGESSNSVLTWLGRHKVYFNRTMSCFLEEDGSYQPRNGMLTVLGQVHHVTAAIELMMSGVITTFDRFGKMTWTSRRAGARWLGLDTGFSGLEWVQLAGRNPFEERPSLQREMQAFDETIDLAATVFGDLTDEELNYRLPTNPMYIGSPGVALAILIDHTAHHRGALAQYARILGREPKIPYFDMAEALHEAEYLDDAG